MILIIKINNQISRHFRHKLSKKLNLLTRTLISVLKDKGVDITVVGVGEKMLKPSVQESMKAMAGSKGTVHSYRSFGDLAKHFDDMLAIACGTFVHSR